MSSSDDRPFVEFKDADYVPLHPGIKLLFALSHRGLSVEDFAKKCGMSTSRADQILKGKADLTEAVVAEIADYIPDVVDFLNRSIRVHKYYTTHHALPPSFG